MNALIGYTGFVGGNIGRQFSFDELYNSKNILDIENKTVDLLICAGIPAEKWKANQDPEGDMNKINSLLVHLENVEVKRFVLISTIDVYKNPIDVNEYTEIETDGLHPYGANRYFVENYVKEKFKNHLIVRLPGLFGIGLKKNFIYDMIHNNALDWTHYKSIFQFYYLENLWKDILTALDNNLSLLNITSEPISAEEIATDCFNTEFRNDNGKLPAFYDMKSKYDYLFGGKDGYLYSKGQVLQSIKDFIKNQE